MLEQSMLARISPRHRNRWPELLAIDERWEACDRRQEQLRGSLVDLRGRRERAEGDYADALAAWMAAGQPEPRPGSEAKALDEAIAEGEGEYAAMDTLRDRILEERIAFVAKHRRRLVADAQGEAEQAQARYLKAIDELAQAREDLIGLRETVVWASLYPSETLQTMAPSHALVGGRRRETEQQLPGVGQLPVHSVLALLRADVVYCATVSTVEQAAGMRGVTTAELTTREAMWAGSEADLARQEREKEQLVAAGGSTSIDVLKLLEAQRFGR
jgi:tetratricopeptide (TPR) repeat protein